MTDSLFFDLFDTTWKMVYFMVGLGLGGWLTYHYGRPNNERVSLQPVGIFAGITTIVFVLVQNLNLTAEMRMCSAEFQRALNARAKPNREFQQLTLNWLTDFDEPPPDIAILPITDPRHVAWFRGTLGTYRVNVVNALNTLDNNPFPQPKCGRQ